MSHKTLIINNIIPGSNPGSSTKPCIPRMRGFSVSCRCASPRSERAAESAVPLRTFLSNEKPRRTALSPNRNTKRGKDVKKRLFFRHPICPITIFWLHLLSGMNLFETHFR